MSLLLRRTVTRRKTVVLPTQAQHRASTLNNGQWTTNLSSITLTIPASTVVGDLLIAAIGANANWTDMATPAGWTLVIKGTNVTNPGAHGIYYRFAQAGDAGATQAFTVTTARWLTGGISAFFDTHPTAPIGASNQRNPAAATDNYPDLTLQAPNSLIYDLQCDPEANWKGHNAPSGSVTCWKQVFDAPTQTGERGVAYVLPVTSAGASPVRPHGRTGAAPAFSGSWQMASVEIKGKP